MRRIMLVLGAMMAFCSTAAPKIFPYCVKASPAELKALGYDGCEIPFVVGPELEQRLHAADAAQMMIGKTYITHDLRNPFPLDKLEAFMRALDGRETVIELVFTGYPAGAAEGVDPAVKLLKEIGTLARAHRLRIALYNHVNTYCESVAFAIELVKKVDLPNVGYAFIVCHWLHREGIKKYRPLLAAHADKLFMVGISGATGALKGWNNLIRPLDEGDFDQAALLQTLKAIDYRGCVGLQCYGIQAPERDHLQRSMAVWRKLTATSEEEKKK